MTVALKIVIECGENVCDTSVYKGCGYRGVKYGNVPFCRLFGVSLQGGEYKHDGGSSYKEYTRCKECKEAQND